MEYDYVEQGQAINALIGIFTGLIVIVMLVVIGLVIAGKTYSVNAADLVDVNDTDPTSYDSMVLAIQNTFGAIGDASSFIIILVLAVIGGLAIAYVIGFSGGGTGRTGAM